MFFPQQKRQPLDSHRKTDARNSRSAQLLNETIVASASADGILRAQLIAGPFESRATVVIETANQAGIENVGNLGLGQQTLHGIKVLTALSAETLENGWSFFGCLYAAWLLAVQYPERIALHAPSAISTKRICF